MNYFDDDEWDLVPNEGLDHEFDPELAGPIYDLLKRSIKKKAEPHPDFLEFQRHGYKAMYRAWVMERRRRGY